MAWVFPNTAATAKPDRASEMVMSQPTKGRTILIAMFPKGVRCDGQ